MTSHRKVRALSTGAVLAVAIATSLGTAAVAGAQVAHTPSSLVALRGSLTQTTDRITGTYSSPRMTIEVALAPRNQAGMRNALSLAYNSKSTHYHQWLAKGQFDRLYGPSASSISSVSSYLRGGGLYVVKTSSPFLLRAIGSSAQVERTLHTTLSTYVDPKGLRYYSNSTSIRLPAAVASHVLGFTGLENTVRNRNDITPMVGNTSLPAGRPSRTPSCETGYVTAAELFAAVNDGTPFPYGYGGGPGCSGLTPSQTNSIYDAPAASGRTQGRGVVNAVFELSAYQTSDIQTWEHYFYGNGFNANITNETVDGGPLSPVCPAGDECPANYNGYSGDIEVDADIEAELQVAPQAHLLVYEAPNDYTGQTELDLYSAIANQDVAATVSSSWGLCENDAGASYAEAENEIFEQMALQGQSVFNSAGDTGAFGCIRSDGTSIVNVGDPASQPWVTSVGGTSLTDNNPGTSATGHYIARDETVWNVDNLCSDAAPGPSNGGDGGYFWCAATGAGGGGSSQFWGRPSYQFGPGVDNSVETFGNGSTQCSLARVGTPCRQVPDVSANADEYTPYAEYCTGSASTPYSVCATFSGGGGWFGIGGTSLSTPLWAAVITDRDSYQGYRTGNINPLMYLAAAFDPGRFLHDITGIGQSTNNNGLFPTTPGYDEATGLGSPDFSAIIEGS